MRICVGSSETLHRFGLNRFLSHGRVRLQPSAESNSTSRRSQTFEEISPGQTSLCHVHRAPPMLQTISPSSESVNLLSRTTCVERVPNAPRRRPTRRSSTSNFHRCEADPKIVAVGQTDYGRPHTVFWANRQQAGSNVSVGFTG